MNGKYRFMTVREVAEKMFHMKDGENIDFTFDLKELPYSMSHTETYVSEIMEHPLHAFILSMIIQ